MATWADVSRDVPEFAARVRSRFDAGTNKTIATLRSDGSPRISGIELEFTDDEVTLGMMSGSVKLRDVVRDPRVAVHSPTLEPPPNPSEWPGEAKLSGLLVRTDGGEDASTTATFRLDLTEVALTYVGEPADHLVIESWHAGRGYRRRTRT